MAGELRNIFISHIHKDDPNLENLKTLISNGGMDVRDSSITADKPNDASNESYIKSEILAPRIRWCSTMVVYISPQTRDSEWVNWEIEYAERLGKRIVGVWAHGAADSDLPDALDKYADAIVGWKSDRIIDAINGRVNGWETSNGTSRDERPIKRYRCD